MAARLTGFACSFASSAAAVGTMANASAEAGTWAISARSRAPSGVWVPALWCGVVATRMKPSPATISSRSTARIRNLRTGHTPSETVHSRLIRWQRAGNRMVHVILSREDGEGSQATPMHLEILRCAQDDGYAHCASVDPSLRSGLVAVTIRHCVAVHSSHF